MHINNQLMTGKQINIHPRLQAAWQEIVRIYPKLGEVAEWDCLQVKLLKVIPQTKCHYDELSTRAGRVDVKISYRLNDLIPVISVTNPKRLAFAMGWYLDFAYGEIFSYMGENSTPQPFSEIRYAAPDLLDRAIEAGLKCAWYWGTAPTVEREAYKDDRGAAFARVFESLVASKVLNECLPLSCSDSLVSILSNPKICRDPYYAFAQNVEEIEKSWDGNMYRLIDTLHVATSDVIKVPGKMA